MSRQKADPSRRRSERRPKAPTEGASRTAESEGIPAPRRRLVWLLACLLVTLVAGWFGRTSLPNSLARRRLAERDLEAARWWLDVTRRLDSRNAEAYFLTARAHRREGELTAASQALRQAQALGWPAEEIDRERQLGQAQWGQLSAAEPHLPDLMTNAGQDGPEVCEAFVVGYLKAHDFTRAHQLLRIWMTDFPEDPQPHFYLGSMYHENDDFEKAIASYQRAWELDARHARAALGAAECHQARKQPTQALEWYRRAEQLAPEKHASLEPTSSEAGTDRLRALVGEARCLRELGQVDEATKIIARVVAAAPDFAPAILEWAQLRSEAGQFAEAVERLAPLAAQRPHDWDLQFAYATALRGTGQVDDAVRRFEAIAEARNQLSKARNLTEQLRRDDVETRYQIGMIHLHYGTDVEALWWLKSALDFEPRHQATHRALADYYAAKVAQDSRYASLAERHRQLAAAPP